MHLDDDIIFKAISGNEKELSFVLSIYRGYMITLARVEECGRNGQKVWYTKYELFEELEHHARVVTLKFTLRVDTKDGVER